MVTVVWRHWQTRTSYLNPFKNVLHGIPHQTLLTDARIPLFLSLVLRKGRLQGWNQTGHQVHRWLLIGCQVVRVNFCLPWVPTKAQWGNPGGQPSLLPQQSLMLDPVLQLSRAHLVKDKTASEILILPTGALFRIWGILVSLSQDWPAWYQV